MIDLNKWIQCGVASLILTSQLTLYAIEQKGNIWFDERQKELIAHVEQSIANAEIGVSKLPAEVLSVPGMSSPKVRHFLNNLCSLPNTGYLEIGCWMGSTWISALYRNYPNMSFAIAIDNWSQFDGSLEQFNKNCSMFLKWYEYELYSADCFKINISSVFKQPVTIYFYDGEHTSLAQELAFTYYDSVLDDIFIAVVDDWNWAKVQRGTRAAFAKLRYEILFERSLFAHYNGDANNWWNGLYVAVIRKTDRSTAIPAHSFLPRENIQTSYQ